MRSQDVKFIGAATGSGSHDHGTRFAAQSLQKHVAFPIQILEEQASGQGLEAFSGLLDFNQRLARATFLSHLQGSFPVVVGGDHSCAIGTWSGISAFCNRPIGLLWIDAHMDAHTFETSETGNIHGMPLATLLGHGDSLFTDLVQQGPKADNHRTVLFGVRSYESGEAALLEQLDVRVFFMTEILERGFWPCWQEALDLVMEGNEAFGISLDLDGLDPYAIPGVGTPEPLGLNPQEVKRGLLPLLHSRQLVGLEIVELNPFHDQNLKSLQLVKELCESCLQIRQHPFQGQAREMF